MCRHELEALVTRLLAENEQLKRRVEELGAQLEATRRAGKRQAAPFAKGEPAARPARPGRKAGPAHGGAARREPPPEVDAIVQVPLPDACPDCGGTLLGTGESEQVQIELPEPRPLTTRYICQRGRCTGCGKAIKARHPDQTSSASGAAGVMLGPRAVAAGTLLHHELGLSFDKVARVMGELGGLSATRSGWCRAAARVGEAAGPTDQTLVDELAQSPAVALDETGWRVEGRHAWLWAGVGSQVTVFRVALGRGFAQAQSLIPADYAGVIERDGWAVYRKFTSAGHQTCLAHLARRVSEMGEVSGPGAPRRLLARLGRLLQDALALRGRRDQGQLSQAELAIERQALGKRADALLAPTPRDPATRRLVAHLRTERPALFTFLEHTGVQATNWRAEQAIRPAVVIRKVWGGHRTWAGARVGQRLMSLIRTCRQRGLDPLTQLVALQRAPGPMVLTLRAAPP
ncbi:MAG: IS66 family transposase [Thermoleophilaceae bacterium]